MIILGEERVWNIQALTEDSDPEAPSHFRESFIENFPNYVGHVHPESILKGPKTLKESSNELGR